METKDTVIRLIAEVLRLNDGEIDNLRQEVGYKRLKRWTSSRHVEIIVAVEDEFDIEVDERAIPRLNNVAKIVAYVEETRS
jgi:acyl carrier protein